MQAGSPEFTALKAGMKAVWTAGDFGQIANYTAKTAEEFVARLGIKPGLHVLDVACGTGNTAIPAARAGAVVTGVDIAPNLIEQARKRAATEQLEICFEEGDAEDLSYKEAQFDGVITMYGAMFAPRPERVAAELLRVTRPGGFIAMANWLPVGFVGQTFQVMAKLAPPPPGLPSPLLWGDESVVRQRFSNGVASLTSSVQKVVFDYPFSPKEVTNFFRQYFGPTQMAFARLDEKGREELATQLEALWTKNNQATDGTTRVIAEYLEVRAIRS